MLRLISVSVLVLANVLSLLLCSFLLAGIEASHNLGEANGSVIFQAVQEWKAFDARAFMDTSDKVESDAGFILGADVDIHKRIGPLVGLGYRYRDGGDWLKQSVWARGGLAAGPITAVLAADLTSENRVRSGELRGRWSVGRFALEPRFAVVRYNGGTWGYHGAVLMGLSFGGPNVS